MVFVFLDLQQKTMKLFMSESNCITQLARVSSVTFIEALTLTRLVQCSRNEEVQQLKDMVRL